jgi:hypothetical protein
MEKENNKQKQDEQEKYRNLHFRMYENEFPKPNELVVVSFNLLN